MQIPSSLSRSVLALALACTAALAWSVWRLPGEDIAPAPAQVAERVRPLPVAPALVLVADASDLSRGLMHTTVSWPVRPGRQWLRFPRWIQGTHAPSGVVENVVNLVVRDDRGTELPWRRDPADTFRFAVDVPIGSTHLAIALSYLANQPTVNSTPVDVLVNASLATINWNTCLLYPEGWRDTALQVTASLRLPAGWQQASALDGVVGADGVIRYPAVDLRTLIDSPVLCGRHLAIHDLEVERFAPHRLAVATSQAVSAVPPPRALAQLRAIAAEARELWGSAPCARYTWLLALGEDVPHLGLEHLASSLNGLSQDTWYDADGLEQAAAYLLAHEYGHVWCGKHHRPAGMLHGDSHSVLDTRLLWVYEGFDQYLGMILAARAGASSREIWLHRMSWMIERTFGNRSRTWRTLEDTAAAAHLLRGRSQNWAQLRGGQDYYLEGMLLCFEADGLIRRASAGARSFDDVLARLFATGALGSVNPFSEEDVVATLRAVEPGVDWPDLIARRVRRTAAEFDLGSLATWGMRATWSEQRPAEASAAGYLDDRWSYGLSLWRGSVREVVPGSAADRARIPEGGEVKRLNDVEFSPLVWEHLLRVTPVGGSIRLRIRKPDGSDQDTVLACPQRPRYLTIAPSGEPAERAVLEAIIAPRSPEGRAVRAGGGGW